ncbi:MAG: S8 family serine peptidase [candidate division KSB1 bacterium]|nr:S8 family serine peptidase [candidate division KSB1 bacterium]MDZ7367159.1 S8 family serine peptidase [candidate division KSB1 bacterium]MDZ7405358.1 S8 family serine peptidase [candidate division KSB1 bacterium]
MKIIAAVAFIFLWVSGPLWGQAVADLSEEMLVYVQPGNLEFPPNQRGALPPDSINIPSIQLRNAFNRFQITSIAKAFPDFSDADTVRSDEAGRLVKIPQFSRIFRLQLPNKAIVDSAIVVLSKIPGVLFAEKNMEARLFLDDDYPLQWHLNNTGQLGGTPGEDIRAESAWSIFTGSSSIRIGVIDSGIELGHDDLTGKSSGDAYTTGANFPVTTQNHGTHVAGIAAASHNNVGRVRGVDANARIVSRRIFQADRVSLPNNPDGYVGDSEAANQIISAVDAGSHVLNNSWGSASYSSTLRSAFAYAYKLNRVAVAAMGNASSSTTEYPAGFGQGIIAVGATTNIGGRSSFSNTGNHIDVSAPGSNIYSTITGNSYTYYSGTSMATPIVSGIASLLKGYNSNLYNDDIEQIIRLGVDDKGPITGWDPEYGTGRVNARKALDYLRAPYTLSQLTATNGTTVSTSGTFQMTFYATAGLADGLYIVKRYVIQKSVTFPTAYNPAPYVWGRGVASNGFNYANPNFGMPWCKVVDGTITTTSATLETVVYEVWSLGGQYLGFKPTTPSSAVLGYTILGIPQPLSVTITGPGVLLWKQWGTWTANPSGGVGSYSYEWRYRNNGTGDWSSVVSTSQNYTRQMPNNDIELQVKVTSGSEIAYDTNYVTLGPIDPKIAYPIGVEENVIPVDFALSQNFPNPFNPETAIRFGLPQDEHVQLVVIDLLGREVRKLVDNDFSAGYHSVVWDGKDNAGSAVASGVYIIHACLKCANLER